MFSQLLQHHNEVERRIILQTHKGNEIENLIELPPGPKEIAKYKAIFEKHQGGGKGSWVERKPPCGVYNCVGHVWASRRTSVFNNLEKNVMMIFEDDGYRVLDHESERIVPGDLITYWGSIRNRSDFYHVGVVAELREGIAPGSRGIPWVLSKWDSTSGEVLHHFQEVPFLDNISFLERYNHPLEIEFWTDRPL